MKKLSMLLLSLLLVLTACANDEKKDETKAEVSASETTKENLETKEETKMEKSSPENSIELGKTISIADFEITVNEYKVVKDTDGNLGLRITYDAKYNGEEDNTPGFALLFKAFQDNTETNDDFFYSEEVDHSIGQKTMKKGGEIKGIHALVGINDLNKPLELELQETISFDNKVFSTVIEDLTQYE